MRLVYLLSTLLQVGNYIADPVVDMLLYKTDFSNESVVGISCEQFPGAFYPRIDSLHIVDKKLRTAVIKELSLSKTASEFSMDARAKLYIYHKSGKVDTLCFQESTWFLCNGRSMELQSDRLISILSSQKGWTLRSETVDNGLPANQ